MDGGDRGLGERAPANVVQTERDALAAAVEQLVGVKQALEALNAR